MNLVTHQVSVYLCLSNHRFLVLGQHAFGHVNLTTHGDGKRVLQHIGWSLGHPWVVRCRCGSLTKRRLKTARPSILEPAWVLGGLDGVMDIVQHLATPIRGVLAVNTTRLPIPVVLASTWPLGTFV